MNNFTNIPSQISKSIPTTSANQSLPLLVQQNGQQQQQVSNRQMISIPLNGNIKLTTINGTKLITLNNPNVNNQQQQQQQHQQQQQKQKIIYKANSGEFLTTNQNCQRKINIVSCQSNPQINKQIIRTVTNSNQNQKIKIDPQQQQQTTPSIIVLTQANRNNLTSQTLNRQNQFQNIITTGQQSKLQGLINTTTNNKQITSQLVKNHPSVQYYISNTTNSNNNSTQSSNSISERGVTPTENSNSLDQLKERINQCRTVGEISAAIQEQQINYNQTPTVITQRRLSVNIPSETSTFEKGNNHFNFKTRIRRDAFTMAVL
jgi:hypothetical protein